MGSPVYLQGTVGSVFVSQTGHHHSKAPGADKSKPFAIDCDECSPYLVKEGGVFRPELVPLTADQEAEKKRHEAEGNLAVKEAAAAMSTAMATILAGDAPKRAARKREAAV